MAAVLVEGFVAVRRFHEPCDVLADDKSCRLDVVLELREFKMD